jgi:hypothetical protein
MWERPWHACMEWLASLEASNHSLQRPQTKALKSQLAKRGVSTHLLKVRVFNALLSNQLIHELTHHPCNNHATKLNMH